MPLSDEKLRIAIFAATMAERDYLRNCLSNIAATVLCFETETSVFDNFKSIQPKIVIARTDSKAVAWRFIFALHALEAESILLIISDLFFYEQLSAPGLSTCVHCVPSGLNSIGILDTIKKLNQHPLEKKNGEYHPPLVGTTDNIAHIQEMMPSLKNTSDPVLITGDSGTGKELLARIIVSNTQSVFIKLNCAELVPEMIARIRITDALQGRFRMGVGGDGQSNISPIIFLLDNINQLHPHAQSEILLLLEKMAKSNSDGTDSDIPLVRFITTSEVNLEQLVQRGRFRKDLYYRINVIPIYLPSLIERKQDIPMLIDYFIIEACVRTQKSFFTSTDNINEILFKYEWPGNIDELRKVAYRLVLTHDESFLLDNYPIRNDKNGKTNNDLLQVMGEGIMPDAIEIKEYLSEIKNFSLKTICDTFVSQTEKKLMKKALESTNWNRKKAAELLNISYKSMLNKMKAYGIV